MIGNVETKEHALATGYVTEHPTTRYDGRNGTEIRLLLANSPIGPAPELKEPFRLRDPFEELAQYPEDPFHLGTRELVLQGIGLTGVNYESLVMVDNGSYGAGDEVIRYLALSGRSKIITPAYSFPNVAQWAKRHNLAYQPLVTPELNPMDSVNQMLELNEEQLTNTVVYLDYPNNPFGVGDPELTRSLIDHVARSGGVPLIDLAFGEVLGDEFREIMQYTIDRDGICIASLSKTQGLPGLRTGYAVLSPKFTNNGYSDDQRMVFGLNREAEFAYQNLFAQDAQGQTLAEKHAARVATYNYQANQYLISQLAELGVTVAPTDLRTPIQVAIGANDPSTGQSFYERLATQGVMTEGLADYQVTLNGTTGYGNSAVRMLTPAEHQLQEVIRRVGLALT